jgi:hypothetical protein
MTKEESDQSETKPRLQLEFRESIIPLPLDRSKGPVILSEEQSIKLAKVIFLCFQEWYAQ